MSPLSPARLGPCCLGLLVLLVDICRLPRDQAVELMRWSAQAFLQHALTPAATEVGILPVRHAITDHRSKGCTVPLGTAKPPHVSGRRSLARGAVLLTLAAR